jgi:hypothetical protein
MHAQSNPQLTTQPADSLVLEQLPSGEYAWLRPVRVVDAIALPHVDPDAPSGYLTDLGQRALALGALFGPWPTVAEASA